jgi:hypothetical protein
MTEPDPLLALLESLNSQSERLEGTVKGLIGRVNTTEEMQTELASQQRDMMKQKQATKTQRGVNLLLGTSLLLDLVLSVAIGVGAWRIDHNAEEIRVLQEVSRTAQCDTATLWLAIVAQSEGEPRTPREQATATEFKAKYQKVYDNLDCSSL